MPERLDGGHLRRDRRAEHRVLVNLRHGRDERGRAERIADAPARHGVRFREAVEEQRALLHARERRERDVRLAAVREVAVNFIRDDDEVVLLRKLRDGEEILARHDRARRVVRVADEQHFRLFRQMLLELGGSDAKFVLELRRHRDGHAACEDRAGLVRDVARLGDQHFVTRREQRAHREVECFADTDCHEHVGLGIVVRIIAVGIVLADFFAELERAAVRRVRRVALLEAVDAALTDRPRRDEIRLADAERDDVFHLRCDVEEFADAGRRDGLHGRGEAALKIHRRLHQGVTTSLRSRSSLLMTVPSFLYAFSMKWLRVCVTPSIVERRVATKFATSCSDLPSMMTRRS